MSADWQISTGFLAELARPTLFAIAALSSAGVLADSRSYFRPRAVALWTAFTLFLPHITLPLYLIARVYIRPPVTTTEEAPTSASPDANDEVMDESAHSSSATSQSPRFARRLTLPLLYAASLLGAGALYFYADYRSADAHLARARQAKLDGRDELAVLEYRASLRRDDDPHVRKLLGLELSKAGRWEEALAGLSAAERGGEPDDALPFHIAAALAATGRTAEAASEYQRFLQAHACARALPDPRCDAARTFLHKFAE